MGFRSYYGRTDHLSGSNDGLQLWDRWLGADRTHPPAELSPERVKRWSVPTGSGWSGRPWWPEQQPQWERQSRRGGAPRLYFLCLARDPVFLARSLLRARLEFTVAKIWGMDFAECRDDQ
jgi:hypothetical protein